MMQVPIIRIPFSEADRSFINQGINEVLKSGYLTMGKYTQEFEKLFADFCGVEYAIATNSGTSALEIILRAIEVEEASVIVPTNTFLATALAVVHAGGKIIFADSMPENLCLDPQDVRRKLRKDTKAVILVHIGGIITPYLNDLKDLCDEYGLYLIEDAAHAHGCSIDGKKAGNLGIAGAFSFFPTKVLTTGEGGMITTNDAELYEKMLMLRNHGKNPKLGNRISELGYNWRLGEIPAVIGVQQVQNAEGLIQKRQEIAQFYDNALQSVEGIELVRLPEKIESSYYKYIVYLKEGHQRDKIKKGMKEEYGVSLTGEVYAELCHNEPVWDKHKEVVLTFTSDRSPGAEWLSKYHICLPVYPDLTEVERNHVVSSLEKTLQETRDADYHPYVFDFDKGAVVAKFEEMYQEVDDPWHQDRTAWAVTKYDVLLTLMKKHIKGYPKILDVGCGKGEFTSRLAEMGQTTGIDVSPTAIEKARNRYPHIDFRVVDILSPNLKEKFNVAVAVELFWYIIDNLDIGLQNTANLLDKDGLAFFLLYLSKEQKIGKNVVQSAEDFMNYVGKHFEVIETVETNRFKTHLIFIVAKVLS